MTEEEIAKRFCKFELCTHRTGEGICCLFSQDNCIFRRLEKENEELRNNGFTVSAMTEQQLKAALEKGEQLENENEKLKRNKKTVVHLADCLEEKMKERIEELETRCTELFLQNNEFAERFEKSIGIIKGLLSCCRNYPQENAEKMEQAEQFLKEIGK